MIFTNPMFDGDIKYKAARLLPQVEKGDSDDLAAVRQELSQLYPADRTTVLKEVAD